MLRFCREYGCHHWAAKGWEYCYRHRLKQRVLEAMRASERQQSAKRRASWVQYPDGPRPEDVGRSA